MQIGKPGEESRTEDGWENKNEIVRRIDRL